MFFVRLFPTILIITIIIKTINKIIFNSILCGLIVSFGYTFTHACSTAFYAIWMPITEGLFPYRVSAYRDGQPTFVRFC